MKQPSTISPASGKLGVLLPGMGAVATTTIAGVLLARQEARLADRVAHPDRDDPARQADRQARAPKITELRPPRAARLSSSSAAGTSSPTTPTRPRSTPTCSRRSTSTPCKEELAAHPPDAGRLLPRVREAPARHARQARPRRRPTWSSRCATTSARSYATAVSARASCVWCGSTEAYIDAQRGRTSRSRRSRRGWPRTTPAISNSQIYAWACIKERVPFANGAPNLSVDFPAAWELARELRGPHRRQGLQDRADADEDRHRAGPQGAHARPARLVLAPTSSATATARCSTTRSSSRRRRCRSSACSSTSCSPSVYPELYGDLFHKVRIEYYPPRGDAKEGWDNIDLFGWLGYPMQIKVNFLCRDSILAAPVVLDLALFLDLAAARRLPRARRSGSASTSRAP